MKIRENPSKIRENPMKICENLDLKIDEKAPSFGNEENVQVKETKTATQSESSRQDGGDQLPASKREC